MSSWNAGMTCGGGCGEDVRGRSGGSRVSSVRGKAGRTGRIERRPREVGKGLGGGESVLGQEEGGREGFGGGQ